MARFVVMVNGTVIDGLTYNAGTILNIPSSNPSLIALGTLPNNATGAGGSTSPLYTIPRLRFTQAIGAGFVDLGTLPPYLPVTTTVVGGDLVTEVDNQVGIQTSTNAFPPGGNTPFNSANVIHEPVLPEENSEYD
jgi:hypothetical protein